MASSTAFTRVHPSTAFRLLGAKLRRAAEIQRGGGEEVSPRCHPLLSAGLQVEHFSLCLLSAGSEEAQTPCWQVDWQDFVFFFVTQTSSGTDSALNVQVPDFYLGVL